MRHKTISSILGICILVILSGFYGVSYYLNSAPSFGDFSRNDLRKIFKLDKKYVSTKLYYSDTEGVGFTYLISPTLKTLMPSEFQSGNEVTLDTVGVKVFSIPPEMNFIEGVRTQVLSDRAWDFCEIEVVDVINYPPTYSAVRLVYKPFSNCPDGWAGKFVFNNEVPGKFIFLPYLPLGYNPGDGSGLTWQDSIRILK